MFYFQKQVDGMPTNFLGVWGILIHLFYPYIYLKKKLIPIYVDEEA